MPFRFTDLSSRLYPSYRDLDDGSVLQPDPGGIYDMEPVVDWLPVPPDDGRWEPVTADPPASPAVTPPAPPPAPPAVTPASQPSTEDQEN